MSVLMSGGAAPALGWRRAVASAVSLPQCRVVGAVLAVSAAAVAPAAASSFTVTPTRILLSSKSPSALLALRNESEETLRFQLTVFAWDQNAQGEMQLHPTEDIVFFPPLLSLAPKESRNVRVGAATPFDVIEKTYRIFVEELPPQSTGAAQSAIRVLTRMGVPIFLQPSKAQAQANLRDLALKDGVFRFNVGNTGNVHYVLERVRVRGTNRSGAVVIDEQADGWYILAGGLRSYELKLRSPECSMVTALAIDVSVGGSVLTQRFETPPAACVP